MKTIERLWLHQLQTLPYPFIDQLPCTTLCFFAHILVLASTHFGVYYLHGAAIQLQYIKCLCALTSFLLNSVVF
jgi:hypothetical protein